MEAVANIDTSGIHPALRETHFMVACDVANPFYGPDGAAYIFAQQKGADSNMVQRLDEGMQSLAEVIKKTTGKISRTTPVQVQPEAWVVDYWLF